MNKLSALLPLASLLLISGCSSPDDKVREAMGDINSWSATAGMAARQWRRGATPAGYTVRTIETAQQNIQETFQQIASIPASRRAATDVDTIVDRIGAMKLAVERDDREEMGRLEGELARREQRLHGDTTESGR